MIRYRIYIVDDEQLIREGLALSLSPTYEIESFADGESVLEAIDKKAPDLVLLDVGLPGINGVEVLRRIKETRSEVLVIMITAYEDFSTVLSTMKLGAYDYVTKPILSESLEVTIRNALETIRLRKEIQLIQQNLITENVPLFISKSKAISDTMKFIFSVAESPETPVLILGDTGTGKELIARTVHYRSPNFSGPFVTFNCAAFSKELLESELFGYEKGAFSGARPEGKKGLVEEADGGTLFMDEVGDLSSEAQAKLLRFLETGEFYRVGGLKKHFVKTRIVSATNKDLPQMVNDKTFRRDLFFRLSVVSVQVPSLKDRKEDILLLANYFIDEFNRKFKKQFTGLSPKSEAALLDHSWTGNVRELKNCVERAVLIGKGPVLEPEELGLVAGSTSPCTTEQPEQQFSLLPIPPEGVDFPNLQIAMEKYYFEQALEMADGNESGAARLLNLNHHTFRYRKKKIL
jgi:two-component system, NtrC family, response regulator AtoC